VLSSPHHHWRRHEHWTNGSVRPGKLRMAHFNNADGHERCRRVSAARVPSAFTAARRDCAARRVSSLAASRACGAPLRALTGLHPIPPRAFSAAPPGCERAPFGGGPRSAPGLVRPRRGSVRGRGSAPAPLTQPELLSRVPRDADRHKNERPERMSRTLELARPCANEAVLLTPHHRVRPATAGLQRWATTGSNRRPHGCEPCALTS
jgi:hypothetical protein